MMDALEQARREIDTVDAQLAALFERRMKAVLNVAEYKKAHGPPAKRWCWTRPKRGSETRPCAPITGTMCRT